MLYRSIIGASLLSLATSTSAALLPKYEFEETQNKMQMMDNYSASEAFTVSSDSFQMRTIFNGDVFEQGTTRLVSTNYNGLTILDINDDNTLSIKEEFSKKELGAEQSGVFQVIISDDDQRIYTLTSERNEDYTYQYYLTAYQIEETGLSVLSKDEVISNGYSGSALTLFKGTEDSHILIWDRNNNQLKVIEITLDDYAINTSHTVNTNGRSIVNAFIDPQTEIVGITYSGYSSATFDCFQSHQLNDSAGADQVDSIACNTAGLAQPVNQAYFNETSKDVMTQSYNGFNFVSFEDDGSINLVASTDGSDFDLTNTYQEVMFKNGSVSYLTNTSPYLLKSYAYNANGEFSLLMEGDLSAEIGNSYRPRVKSIKGNLWIASENYDDTHSLIEKSDTNEFIYYQSTVLGDDSVINQISDSIIPLSEDRVVNINNGELQVINTENSKNYLIEQTIAIPGVQYFYNSNHQYRQLTDTQYLVFMASYYVIFSVDQESGEVTIDHSGEYETSDYYDDIYSNNSQLAAAWIHDKFLIGKMGQDRLGLFEMTDGQLNFREFLVDFAGDMQGINQTTDLIEIDNEIYMVRPSDNLISKLIIAEDGSYELIADYLEIDNLEYVESTISLENKVLIIDRYLIHTLGIIDGELEYLSISPKSGLSSSLVSLDNRYLFSSSRSALNLYEVEENTGAVVRLGSLDIYETDLPVDREIFGLKWDGENIWYYTSYSNRTFGKLDINRAPIWKNYDETNLLLSQGASTEFSLETFVTDYDKNTTLDYSEISMAPSVSFDSETGLMTYDGTLESFDSLVVGVSDQEINGEFTFSIEQNFAPTLVDGTEAFIVNENDTLVIDLESVVSDIEGDSFVFTLAGNGSLEVLGNGSLTGTVTSNLGDSVSLTVTDARGAIGEVSIPLAINRAPLVNGSLTEDGQVGEDLSIDLNTLFNDPEGDAMVFRLTGSIAGLTESNGVISGKPSKAGEFSMVVIATDNKGASSEAILKVNVTQKSGGGAMGIILALVSGLVVIRRRRH